MSQDVPHSGLKVPRCSFCGVRITIHQQFQPGHCGAPECIATHAVQGKKINEEKFMRS